MYTVGGKNKQKNKKGFVRQWTTSVTHVFQSYVKNSSILIISSSKLC